MKNILIHTICLFSYFDALSQNLDSAISAYAYGDYDRVEALTKQVINDQPNSTEAHALYAKTLLAKNEIDSSLAYLERLISLNGNVSSYHHWKGEALLKKLNQIDGFFESGRTLLKARDALFKAVEIDGNNVDARLTLAGYYFEAPGIIGGSKLKANKEIEYVIKKNPIMAGLFMADYHVQENKLLEARDVLLQLVRNGEVSGEVHHALGRVYQQKKEYENAFSSFKAGILLDDHASYYQFARTAVFAGKHIDLGIEYMSQYLRKRPKKNLPAWSYAHWRLGMLYELNGDIEKAIKEYKNSLNLNPDATQVRDVLKKLEQ